MKIFNKTENHRNKVNFVDENNVYLGYDMDQCCCENADWFIADKECESIRDRESNEEIDMPGWTFDTSFFKEVNNRKTFDDGGMVIFRIINGDNQKYIHLYNVHNGYYGHGFDFNIGKTSVREGTL